MEEIKRKTAYRCCNTCLYKDNSFYGCSKASECYNGFSAYSPNAEMKEAAQPAIDGRLEGI